MSHFNALAKLCFDRLINFTKKDFGELIMNSSSLSTLPRTFLFFFGFETVREVCGLLVCPAYRPG